MNEWLAQVDFNSAIICLLAGLIIALVTAISVARVARRKGVDAEKERLQPINKALEADLEAREVELAETQRALAITETRLEEQ